ncbi:MAG: hypothetical protein QXF56_00440 [Candidatus Micrarchaeia archaeon]
MNGKKEELKEMFSRSLGQVEREKEVNRVVSELESSWSRYNAELVEIRKRTHAGRIGELEGKRRELQGKVEKKMEEVRKELDGLHKMIEKYEKKIREKDEAERELMALEEIKVMLSERLRRIMERVSRLKVRKGSDIEKLLSEARELEVEVERSGEEVLDFEREYSKFLSIMKELSG